MAGINEAMHSYMQRIQKFRNMNTVGRLKVIMKNKNAGWLWPRTRSDMSHNDIATNAGDKVTTTQTHGYNRYTKKSSL